MRKLLSILTIITFALVLVGCSSSNNAPKSNEAPATRTNSVQNNEQNNANKGEAKVLVVYYSRSGNTAEMARQIQQRVGGDLLELKTVKTYPQGYNDMTKLAKEEQQAGIKPELQSINLNIEEYETIFIGSPNWWSDIAPPVLTFLTQYDFSDKTIVPFMTHEGRGLGRSVEHIRDLLPNAKVLDGLAVRGSGVKTAQKEISDWLLGHSLIK